MVPCGAESFSECLRMGVEVFHALKAHPARARPLHRGRATRAALRPTSPPTRRRCRWCSPAIEAAGYEPGTDVAIALDPATCELYRDGAYVLEHEGRTLSAAELADYWADARGALPDRLARGRHGRGGLGRLEGAHRARRGAPAAGGRRRVRHQHRAPAARHRAGGRQLDPRQGQPDRHPHRDARRDRHGARGRLHRGHDHRSGRDRGHRRSPTSRWRRAAGRSRPAPPRAPIAPPSTTSCCASRSSWAPTPNSPGARSFAAERVALGWVGPRLLRVRLGSSCFSRQELPRPGSNAEWWDRRGARTLGPPGPAARCCACWGRCCTSTRAPGSRWSRRGKRPGGTAPRWRRWSASTRRWRPSARLSRSPARSCRRRAASAWSVPASRPT